MFFAKGKNIDDVWKNICKHEGESFYTMRKIAYTYTVKDNYILINNDTRRKVTKEYISKALSIPSPTPSKIELENIWGPSYVYGIITDKRII